MPLINFNNSFSLYRSMHKLIIGIYLQIAAMPKAKFS